VIEFSEAGYLEVFRGDVRVSRHRQEREAIESVLRHAESAGPGDYEIRRPVIRVRVMAGDSFEINGTAVLP
jgi:hypothetical protein